MWEISQKTVLKMAADRGAFIDQSQSLNIHIAQPNYGKLSSMHFYGWKLVRKGRESLCYLALTIVMEMIKSVKILDCFHRV